MRVLLIFLDGVGIGGSDPDVNPFMRARLDTLTSMIGDKQAFVSAEKHQTIRATLMPLDARLGVAGLPQSGTGQTALFTGINAPAEFGRHFGPWVPTALRERLARENILTRCVEAGVTAAFANAYPEELFREVGEPREPRNRDRTKGPVLDPLRAGPPIAALGAGLLNRHTDHLMRGEAVASEITNDGWRKHLMRTELPVITPAQAGRNLGRVACRHTVTLFAHYSTDYIGHSGHMWEAVEALQKIDEFIAGVAASITEDVLVLVTSDHGNIEDITAGHTLNPALLLAFGHEHRDATDGMNALVDVAPRILDLVGVSIP